MMSQPCPSNTRFLVAIVLFCSGILLTGSAAAAVASTVPVEIAFETTSPYYQPPVAVVLAGAPVRWVNTTGSPHSVRHDGCLTDETCAFQSIAVPPDSSFLLAPLPPGRYGYHCELHPIMRGTLVVVDPLTRADGMISALEATR
jgi:plastocyanin